MSITRVLGATALMGQRQGWLRATLPLSVRQRVGSAASGLITRSTGDLVDDWSCPLVGVGTGVPTQVAPAPPTGTLQPRSPRVHAAVTELHPEAPRCLLVTASLDVARGLDEMVAFLALRLRSNGFRTAVLLTPSTPHHDFKDRLAPMLSAAGIEVAAIRDPAARTWIRRWAPDVISAHDAPDWVLDEARSMAVPYIKVLHGMHGLFHCDWDAEAERSRDMEAIVAVSEIVRRQYRRGVPTYPSERIVTIPNGVDDRRRLPHDRLTARAALGLTDEFLFVCLARYDSNKNQFGLLSAFGEVADRHPDAHLLMAGQVGQPAYSAQVRQAWQRLAARDRVHLRDHATDPAFLLAAADGFVLNSFFEGGPLATMEALYAGVPVVASDVGGVRDQLGADPSRGYLIPNPLGDPLDVNWATIAASCYTKQINLAELVESMCALVREREDRAAMRETLAAESAERFHPDHCLRAHADLLLSCVNGRMFSSEQAALDPRPPRSTLTMPRRPIGLAHSRKAARDATSDW
jgi:glycosyltransferase involved in cell wall biosynthesis